MTSSAPVRSTIILGSDADARRAALTPIGGYVSADGDAVTIAQDGRSHQLVRYVGVAPAVVRPVGRWDLARDIAAGRSHDLPAGSKLARTVEFLARGNRA